MELALNGESSIGRFMVCLARWLGLDWIVLGLIFVRYPSCIIE